MEKRESGCGQERERERGRECEAAMALARRAYLYNLLHVVFGSAPSREGVAAMFGEQGRDVLEAVRDELGRDGFQRVARHQVGSSGRSAAACMDEACACVRKSAASAGDEAFIEALASDYARLFQVPGASYVHPWESPYVGKESMVFQESTLDVRSFYHEAGFKLRAEKHFPDDHIAAMMDYLGRTSQRAYEAYADGRDSEVRQTLAVQGRFLDKHLLTWVDAFASAVIQKDGRAFYAAFAGVLAAFARMDRAVAARLEEELTAQED